MRALFVTLGSFGIGLLITACDHGEATFPPETNTANASAAQPTIGEFGDEATATITNGQDVTFSLTGSYAGTDSPAGNTFAYPATISLDGTVISTTPILFTIISAPTVTTTVNATVGGGSTGGGSGGSTGVGGGWSSATAAAHVHAAAVAAPPRVVQTTLSGDFNCELVLNLVAVPVGTHTLTVHWGALPSSFSGIPMTDTSAVIVVTASTNG